MYKKLILLCHPQATIVVCLSLWVSSKAYIIGQKETKLKRGVIDTLFMSTFYFQMMFLAMKKHILCHGVRKRSLAFLIFYKPRASSWKNKLQTNEE